MAKGKLSRNLDDYKAVPGYEGRYVVSFEGIVYRIYKKGFAPILPVVRRGVPCVRLTNATGRRREFTVVRLMQMAWLGPVPKGMVRYHKNGDRQDNIVTNIGFICRQKLGRLTGGEAKRQPVIKIDQQGEMQGFYPSARQAAKENFMSYQTIIDRCNGKVKSKYAPDGYAYAWDDND